MSVTPPAGYGIWAQTWQPSGGLRRSVCVVGFRNVGANLAAGCGSNMSAAFNGVGKLFDITTLDSNWSVVQHYTLINTAGVLSSATTVVNVPGGATGADSLPPQVSMVVSKRSAIAGRQYRGRFAVPGGFVDETNVNDAGIIDSTVAGVYQTFATASLTAATSNGVPLYLLHGVPIGGIVPVPTLVTSLGVSTLTGSQRRRVRR